MKTKEELNALKEEAETVNRKLHELTDEELAQVSGGIVIMSSKCPACNTALGRWITFTDEQKDGVLNNSVQCPNCGWQNIVYYSNLYEG